MPLAFTICSNNYFHYATVLGKSWLQYHPDSCFGILIVDELAEGVNYKFDERVIILSLAELQLDNLETLVRQYNITELNTAVKADAFLYFFRRYGASKVFYIDPDIRVYSPFEEAISLLDNYNIVVTPHYCTPIDDGSSTTDIKMMGSGLFNLGFLGLSRLDKVLPFLEWWRARLYKYAYYDLARNMFYDQVWMNYIVVFFDNYAVLKHPGYNMANWNFHERSLSVSENGNYLVNGHYPLRFFHFSGYKFNHPGVISFYHDRYTFATRPDIAPVYAAYQEALLAEHAVELSKIPCIYYEQHKQQKAEAETAAWERLPVKTKVIRKLAATVRKMLN